jgi:SAM-dependent methyltransferase
VTRGAWEYAAAEDIARQYDADLAEDRLCRFDRQIVERALAGLPPRSVVVDLGCGTGRLLLTLAERGLRGVAVDLSLEMLRVLGDKAEARQLEVDRVRANLVELDCLADGIADAALCMYSTLGMVQGRENRRRVLAHVQRILRPGGIFVLHVHNRWSNAWLPQARSWLLRDFLTAWLSRTEAGDKRFDYRGVRDFWVHLFTRRELARALRQAGFAISQIVPLAPDSSGPLRRPWFFGRLRAGGWIVVCRSSESRLCS